jgi:hypothetical protein
VTTGSAGATGIPRAMVLRLIRALPGDRALLPPSLRGLCVSGPKGRHRYLAKLDPSVGGSGPHDFAGRIKAARPAAPTRPSHPAPNTRDDRVAPLSRVRDAQTRTTDLPDGASGILWAKEVNGRIVLRPLANVPFRASFSSAGLPSPKQAAFWWNLPRLGRLLLHAPVFFPRLSRPRRDRRRGRGIARQSCCLAGSHRHGRPNTARLGRQTQAGTGMADGSHGRISVPALCPPHPCGEAKINPAAAPSTPSGFVVATENAARNEHWPLSFSLHCNISH